VAMPADTITTIEGQHLDGVEVTTRRKGITRMKGAVNGQLINKEELFRAACCNLGESFVTNPSVDVHYSDAATGAQQIRLLGLSGKYVQMLTENMPDFRGASIPYSLDYVPGPWMQSIQVSKGNASVRNGYEAMTGQINVEYLKPEADEGVTLNMYGSTEGALETNADANVHVNKRLSTEVLGHFQNMWNHHDSNGDGFQQMVKVKQYNFQNRWAYLGQKYIFHGGIGVLDEDRTSGQVAHAHNDSQEPLFRIGIKTDRYSAYMKHALVLNRERNTSVALMASGTMHEMDASYGRKAYDVNEKNVYAQLMFETDFTSMHNFSAGASLNYDYLDQHFRLTHDATAATEQLVEKETTPGVYAQYTFNYNNVLTAMVGIRVDNSSLYGTFVTPRLHVKWQPCDIVGFRASAGKGYRTVHAFAEYNYLMSSGRQFTVGDDLKQESAWNYGISSALNIPLGQRTLTVNAEYYYTHFGNQVDVDYDADPTRLIIDNIKGKSYSHTIQVDATYEVVRGLSLTAAYRRNIVKAMYGGEMKEKPLQSRYKGLLTASYKTPLGLWQVDATLQLNGGGRMPTPYVKADGTQSWDATFKAYEQVTAQVTRWFRHFSVYVGSENLTGFVQKTPVYDAANPWNNTFDPTLVWAPTSGRMFYAGVRINIGRL
jgi:outer membrane receptor for ferrienterochelin and colicin